MKNACACTPTLSFTVETRMCCLTVQTRMYALVTECDDDHARTHRALAHVANAEHLPVGRSLAIVIVGQLRLTLQRMRSLVKNWVGICDQVMISLPSPAQQRTLNYMRHFNFEFSCWMFA
jgi:hypothetical protein